MRVLFLFVLLGVGARVSAQGSVRPGVAGPVTYVYKQELKLDVYEPDGAGRSFPAVVLFHGGSWIAGDRSQLSGQCRYFAERGVVAITADYRLMGKDTGIVDAKSAVRWVVGHAALLHIDTGKLILGGASAGGQLATMALLATGHNDPQDDLSIRIAARALVLFNPAYSLTDDPAVEPYRWVDGRVPPAVFFYGSKDKWKPAGDSLRVLLKKAGVVSEEWVAPGQVHGFFNKEPWKEATCVKAQDFLSRWGLMVPAADADRSSGDQLLLAPCRHR